MGTTKRRILGIDPGYDRVGIAILESGNTNKESLLFSECFTTPSTLPLADRIVMIGKELERLISEYRPNIFAIEKVFFTSNQKTAFSVSEAKGAMIYIARSHNLEVYELTPLQIKQAMTGYGRATKEQVDTMVRQLITLPEKKMIDDEIDAIAVSLTCNAMYRTLSTTKLV